jgi:preprotein translocase subunit SecE
MISLAQAREYTSEVVEELKKVTWPDRAQLRNATLVVIVFVIVIAIIIWLMDLGVRGILNVILDIFAG